MRTKFLRTFIAYFIFICSKWKLKTKKIGSARKRWEMLLWISLFICSRNGTLSYHDLFANIIDFMTFCDEWKCKRTSDELFQSHSLARSDYQNTIWARSHSHTFLLVTLIDGSMSIRFDHLYIFSLVFNIIFSSFAPLKHECNFSWS